MSDHQDETEGTRESALAASNGAPPFWLWPVLVPVLPVVFALGILEWVGMPSLQLTEQAVATDAAAALRHGAARLLFGAAVAVHTAACAGAVVYFTMGLVRVGGRDLRWIMRMVVAVAAAVIVTMAVLGLLDPPLSVYQYTYYLIANLLTLSAAGADLLGTIGGVPILGMCVLFPTALGVVAVVMASGVACGVLRRVGPNGDPQWTARLVEYTRVLLHCFYLLSAMLVTSSAAASLFFRLPLGLVSTASDHEAVLAALSGYAGTLSAFWGAIFTVTLFAAFVGPVAVLYARARIAVAGVDGGITVAAWLKEQGIGVSFTDNVKNLFVLLAPFLVGPLGELAKSLGG